VSRTRLSDEAWESLYADRALEVDWVLSLGTTVGFAALMLAGAVWIFRRRDY
jgi:hypothetical protein